MSNKPVILVMSPCEQLHVDMIRAACPDCELRFGPDDNAAQVVDPELIRDVEILFATVPPTNFDDMKQLRYLQIGSAGYSHITHLPLVQRNIAACNALGVFDSPIAEWNILMMLFWQRSMLGMLENQKNGIWDRSAKYQSDLFGRTVGFIGYGGIARETARLAKAMHLRVHAITRDGSIRSRDTTYRVEGTGDPDGRYVDQTFAMKDLHAFLSSVDYAIITTPHTPQTEGMIGEAELRAMKPSAVLINPARAPIVKLDALLRCLNEKWIRGAAFDVHYAYPLPDDHPLWRAPNLVLTPHISGSDASPHYLERVFDIFTQNVKRYRAGQPLLNRLSDAQLQETQ